MPASGVETTFGMPITAYGSRAMLDVCKRIEMIRGGFMYAIGADIEAYSGSECRMSSTKHMGRHFDSGRPHLLLLFELPGFLFI